MYYKFVVYFILVAIFYGVICGCDVGYDFVLRHSCINMYSVCMNILFKKHSQLTTFMCYVSQRLISLLTNSDRVLFPSTVTI